MTDAPGPALRARAEAWIANEGRRLAGNQDGIAIIRELLALTEEGARPQWLPIASAPKDGTLILGWAPVPHVPEGEVQSIRWDNGVRGWLAGWAQYGSHRPTHWMPLPEPPK